MKFSFYFDVYPWTKETDVIYLSTHMNTKSEHAIRYRFDVQVKDPAEPDIIIPIQAVKVIDNQSVLKE